MRLPHPCRPEIRGLTHSFVMAFCLLGWTAAYPQVNDTANIVGELRVSRLGPPSRRMLITLDRSGVPVSTSYSDAEGRFAFLDLPANLYHITLREEGYQPVDLTVPVNPATQHTVFVHVELVPDEKRQPAERGLKGSNPALVDEATLLQKFPKKATQQYEKATQLQAEGKRDKAIEHYQQALKLAPDMYFARNNLGSLYLEEQKYAEAENEFRQVVEANQADANGYFNLANVCLLTKRLDQSLDFAKQGLARQPQSSFGHFLLGSVLFQKGNHKEAEAALLKSLREDPGMSNAHLALVNLYLLQHRNDDAAQHLQVFLKQSPDSNFAPQARTLLKKLQPEAAVPR